MFRRRWYGPMFGMSPEFIREMPNLKGVDDMTKARARQRAKAKAGQKAAKREANASEPGQTIQPGQFDPGSNSISSPMAKANTRNLAGARRGAARSR